MFQHAAFPIEHMAKLPARPEIQDNAMGSGEEARFHRVPADARADRRRIAIVHRIDFDAMIRTHQRDAAAVEGEQVSRDLVLLARNRILAQDRGVGTLHQRDRLADVLAIDAQRKHVAGDTGRLATCAE